MSKRGRRFDDNAERKLNIKKVVAVAIVFLVIIMSIVLLVNLNDKSSGRSKKVALRYYTSYADGKWGVINSKGEVIIDNKYDEMIAIPNPEKAVFIVTENVNYEDGTYSSKAIDNNEKQLFTNYDKVEAIQNYNDNLVLEYEANSLKVQKDGKYGLINFSGSELLAPSYDSISPAIGIKNSLITEKDGKKGLVGITGSVIVNNQYQEIQGVTKDYELGYIVKNDDGNYGVIGTNRKETVPVKYQEIKHVASYNTYFVKKDDAWFIYNPETSAETEFKYSDAVSVNGDNIIVKGENGYGIINRSGEEILAPKYQDLKYAFGDYYIAKKDDKYGVITTGDETKIEFKYSNLYYMQNASLLIAEVDSVNSEILNNNFEVKLSGIISELNTDIGYIKLRSGSDYKYYNFKFEEKKNREILTDNTIFLDKKDGKYGFVDKNGVVVANYIYEDATEQNASSYVAVKQNGKWGSLDENGRKVADTIYDLSNNSVINFIGVWHLAEDTNANYYTK